MGKKLSIGVSSAAHKGKKAWLGVSNAAHKVKKAWIGDASGKARLFFSSGINAKILYYNSNTAQGRSYISDDGITGWKNSSSTYKFSFGGEKIAYAFGKFWMVGPYENGSMYIYYSTDGIVWTKTTQKSQSTKLYSANGVLFNSKDSTLYFTKDGSSWSYVQFSRASNWSSTVSINDVYDVKYGTLGGLTGYFAVLDTKYGASTVIRICYFSESNLTGGAYFSPTEIVSGISSINCFTLIGGNMYAFSQESGQTAPNLKVWKITNGSSIQPTFNLITNASMSGFWSTDKYLIAVNNSKVYKYKYGDALTSVTSTAASSWGSGFLGDQDMLFLDGMMFSYYGDKVAYSEDYGVSVTVATMTADVAMGSDGSSYYCSVAGSSEITNGYYTE